MQQQGTGSASLLFLLGVLETLAPGLNLDALQPELASQPMHVRQLLAAFTSHAYSLQPIGNGGLTHVACCAKWIFL